MQSPWFIYTLDVILLFFIGTFFGFIRRVQRAIRETNAYSAQMQTWLTMFKTPFDAVYIMKDGVRWPLIEARGGCHFMSWRVKEGLVVEVIDEGAAN